MQIRFRWTKKNIIRFCMGCHGSCRQAWHFCHHSWKYLRYFLEPNDVFINSNQKREIIKAKPKEILFFFSFSICKKKCRRKETAESPQKSVVEIIQDTNFRSKNPTTLINQKTSDSKIHGEKTKQTPSIHYSSLCM